MGHKPRLSKTRALAALNEAIGSLPEGTVIPCVKNPELYQDLPDDVTYTEDEAEALCAGCPLYQVCRDYGKADRAATGVWGGIFYPNDRQENNSRKKEEK